MPTNKEKYGHSEMNISELEARAAADLYELSNRLIKNEKTQSIGELHYMLMRQLRESFRTAELIISRYE